jgi:hypothetical protein
VAYVKYGGSDPAIYPVGFLTYRVFNIRTGLQAPEVISNNNTAGFVRSTMDPPSLITNCPPAVLARKSKFRPSMTQGKVNYLSFDESDDGVIQSKIVKLLRFRHCGDGVKSRIIDVGEGRRPSVAMGRDNIGKPLLLVVYGRDDRHALWGRFFDINGAPKGDAIELGRYPNQFLTFGTDIIWNARSHRFIAAIHVKSGINPESASGCRIYNLSIMPDGVSSLPKERGRCDVTRGHHTWVDIENRPDTNPEGLYAWWYQDMEGKKAIRIMDRFGNPTGEEVFWNLSTGTQEFQPHAYTVAFAAVNNGIPVNNGPQTTLKFIPEFVTAASHRPNGNHPVSLPFSVRGFFDDGKLHKIAPLRSGHNWYLHAVGSLHDRSVYLYSEGFRCPPDCSDIEELRMAVRLNERAPVVLDTGLQ